MTQTFGWLKQIMFRSIFGALIWVLAGGVLVTFVAPAILRPPGVEVDGLREDDGIVARGGEIEIIGVRHGTMQCPGPTQRYLWRRIKIDGKDGTQVVPLEGTDLPAFLPPGPFKLTIPAPRTMEDGEWFYRGLSTRECSILPAWLGGKSTSRTVDVPVQVMGGQLQ